MSVVLNELRQFIGAVRDWFRPSVSARWMRDHKRHAYSRGLTQSNWDWAAWVESRREMK